MLTPDDTRTPSLGAATQLSPLVGERDCFIADSARVLVPSLTPDLAAYKDGPVPSFEQAGPRQTLFFDPSQVRCGVLTCGGLCPGLNDVIRSIVMTLHYRYRVPTVYGFRYGYAGLARVDGLEPRLLTPQIVKDIHEQGGTLLGSSRGPQDLATMADTLQELGINILFCIGGDGTLRGASALSRELARRDLNISVIGVPKTIDNDIDFIERSFGFATAVEEATRALGAAHNEARGAFNGVGLVKLMGRHSGFITAHAALANSDVNACLVPEVPFDLHGEGGFLDWLESRLASRGHALIAVAEGAAQDALASGDTDASGNLKLGDVGVFLRGEIKRHFEKKNKEITVKYIDPSYIIRSVSASALDSEFCLALGQHAVHAGLAGKTDIMIGYWNRHFTHVPLTLATQKRKQLEPISELWQRVLGATGQPEFKTGNSKAAKTVEDERESV